MRQVILFLIVLISDQLTKKIFSTDILNRGGVFGFGEGGELFWIIVLLTMIMGIWVFLERRETMRNGLVVVFSAGLSNLIDRSLFGGVRDFIWWPVLSVYGNVADVWLVVGAFMVIWYELKARKNRNELQ